MRRQKIKSLYRLIAFNIARVDSCCGIKKWDKLCENCNIKKNIIDWALFRMATKIKKLDSSHSFAWIKTEYSPDKSFCFVVEAQNTKEIIKVLIDGPFFKRAVSAKNLRRLK